MGREYSKVKASGIDKGDGGDGEDGDENDNDDDVDAEDRVKMQQRRQPQKEHG